MDRADRLSTPGLFEIPITLQLVTVYVKRDPADEPLFAEEPGGLAKCAVPFKESVTTAGASAPIELWLIWTAMIVL